MDEMDEPWTLEDSLSSACADLLSYEKFELFVCRLFTRPQGSWHTVAELCQGLPELPSDAALLFPEHAEALVVTHLRWPEPESADYALVLFVHGGEFWSTIAAYNRQRLDDQYTTSPPA